MSGSCNLNVTGMSLNYTFKMQRPGLNEWGGAERIDKMKHMNNHWRIPMSNLQLFTEPGGDGGGSEGGGRCWSWSRSWK